MLSEVKRLVAEVGKIDALTKEVQEKDNKLQCLRENKRKMKETLEILSVRSERYQKLAEFMVNEYHPAAR